jgi:nucleotidyltransferase/DNA polymerase involved in DNA repair
MGLLKSGLRHSRLLAADHWDVWFQLRHSWPVTCDALLPMPEVTARRIDVRKSVGAENTFSSDLRAFEARLAELQPRIDKVWRHCEDKGTRGRHAENSVHPADSQSAL